MLEKQIKRTI